MCLSRCLEIDTIRIKKKIHGPDAFKMNMEVSVYELYSKVHHVYQ